MIVFKNRVVNDFFWSGLFVLFLYWTINNPVTHPIPKLEEGLWSIEEMQRPLLGGIVGHNFLVLRDEGGKIISELHGLATDTTTGEAKFVTFNKGEKLRVWEFDKPKYNLSENKFAGKILKEGNKDTILSMWDNAKNCGEDINNADFLYSAFKLKGQTENSNSVAYTLASCMGVDTKHLGLIIPGDRFNLLNR